MRLNRSAPHRPGGRVSLPRPLLALVSGLPSVLLLALELAGCATTADLTSTPLPLPGGAPGIGFDDLRYASRLSRVLAPAGRSGNLDLVDPVTRAVTAIGGFSAADSYDGGHDFGTTSVDEGGGLLYAIDRTSRLLSVVDPAAGRIVASVQLAASPDYVRYVSATGELWVSEPDGEQLEVFTLSSDPALAPVHAASISIPGGPESLVLDNTRGRAYSHLWAGKTVAIDLKSRSIVAEWPNQCSGSRGIALDEARGFLFAACSEGVAVVLDVAHDGKVLSSLAFGSGVDVIDYDPGRRHLYFPASKTAMMAILAVSEQGTLSRLGTATTAQGAHCVTVDRLGNAYVCDPGQGQLLVVKDPY